MKLIKSILITLLCAVAILAVGYAGIILCGDKVLESAIEPEQITMDANISNLFYSRLEDDIQLYPWNYYKEDEAGAGDGAGFMEYSSHVEYEVFYNLIALAADVETQEVSSWYAGQEKTIMESLIPGVVDGNSIGIYFYDEVIRLSGKDYRVKISCSPYNLISFSCIQCREEGIKETVQWNENKEQFLNWSQRNPIALWVAWERMQVLFYDVWDTEGWYEYVSLYQSYLKEVGKLTSEERMFSISDEEELIITDSEIHEVNEEKGYVYGDLEEFPIQMIELKDSLLLMMEEDITMGVYYDVLEQRVVGFHFFND